MAAGTLDEQQTREALAIIETAARGLELLADAIREKLGPDEPLSVVKGGRS
jgi:hypothetical protein